MTDDAIGRGLEFFAEALVKEPRYGRARAGIALAHAYRAIHSAEPPHDAMGASRTAIKAALAIDDTLDEAHFASGLHHFWYGWDWGAAKTAYQRVFELNSNHAASRGHYGYMLACLGHPEERVRQAERAVRLDPLSPETSHVLAATWAVSGRFEEAIDQERKTLELDSASVSASWGLGTSYMGLGRFEDAIVCLREGLRHSPEDVPCQAILGEVLGLAGQETNALRVLDWLEALRQSRYIAPVCMAWVHIGLDRTDAALDWLGTAYEDRDPLLVMVNSRAPYFDPLRSAPRFQALLRRMNFPETAETPPTT